MYQRELEEPGSNMYEMSVIRQAQIITRNTEFELSLRSAVFSET